MPESAGESPGVVRRRLWGAVFAADQRLGRPKVRFAANRFHGQSPGGPAAILEKSRRFLSLRRKGPLPSAADGGGGPFY